MDNESWNQALASAARDLDDANLLADLACSVAELAREPKPQALALVGGAPLHRSNRVGLVAGSFNPLTRAHVELVSRARAAGALDVVAWSEAVVTIDKERVTRATLVDRLAQLRAFSDRAPARTDAVVLVNRGLYADQARSLQVLLAPNAELSIIVGYDKLVQIFDPRYYDDRDTALRQLFDVARLLVAPRDRRDAVDALLDKPENRPFANFVAYFDLLPDIAGDSATQARALSASLPAHTDAIRALVTPEGYALALTGAYAADSTAHGDVYGWRQRWEAVLPRVASNPTEGLVQLPRMAALVHACLGESPGARAIRTLVGEVAEGGNPAALRAALAHLTGNGDGPR